MSKRQRRKIEGFSADYRGVYGDKPEEQPETAEPPQDIEIDDFLPEEQQDEGEELLTKWDDGLEPEPEPEEPEVPERPVRTVRRRRRRYGVAVGALVLILALVGVGFIAATIGKSIYFAATDDSKLRAYDSFLTTVVMQDPKPFASPDKADEEFVLNASLWKTITENNGTNYNSYDDTGRILVPLGDVVDSCRALFGPDCQLQPKTPAQETFFEYNSEENQFHVALYSSDSSFLPYTESAKKQGDSTVLHVGYVSPSDTWRTQTTSAVAAPTPTKYMDYVLKTDSSTGQEYVYAIQAPEG
ncbi:hypothetical protein [Clostridium sp. KNHs216]|jgi:hypothetical protein|uniref:hypothetical protein n=1 Tax=Clostridium sp. KNHs216 TaxID=1550235 RepID=UPI0006896696|nr:hypothetical protein [Clostridium sp. KNHs216]TQI67566.1 hypothetical protein LY85_2258 [Clostridium sp. KNHs216]